MIMLRDKKVDQKDTEVKIVSSTCKLQKYIGQKLTQGLDFFNATYNSTFTIIVNFLINCFPHFHCRSLLSQYIVGPIVLPLLCYVLLCYAMLCYVTFCCVVLCCAVLCCAVLCYAMLCFV